MPSWCKPRLFLLQLGKRQIGLCWGPLPSPLSLGWLFLQCFLHSPLQSAACLLSHAGIRQYSLLWVCFLTFLVLIFVVFFSGTSSKLSSEHETSKRVYAGVVRSWVMRHMMYNSRINTYVYWRFGKIIRSNSRTRNVILLPFLWHVHQYCVRVCLGPLSVADRTSHSNLI